MVVKLDSIERGLILQGIHQPCECHYVLHLYHYQTYAFHCLYPLVCCFHGSQTIKPPTL